MLGPHLVHLLPKQAGFGLESKVAPEGARKSEDWKPAKDVDELKAFFRALFDDVEKFNLENERGSAGNRRGRTGVAVGGRRRADEF